MADNVAYQSATLATPAAGTGVATDKVTHSGDANQDVQLMRPVHVTGAEGSKTVVDITTSEGNLQTITPNRTATATLDADEEALTIDTDGMASVVFQVTASDLDGSITFDGSADGTNWINPLNAGYYQTGFISAGTAQAGDFFVVAAGSFLSVRVRIQTYTSGSVTIVAVASPTDGRSAMPGYSALVDGSGSGFAASVSAGALSVADLTARASLSVLDDWDESDRAKVNPIVGQAGVQGGAGGVSATTQRVAIATDANAISGTVAVTGVSTAANQTTEIGHLATIAGDTTDIEAAVELIDDTVQVLGTDLYSEATSKGITLGAVRRDADTTLVGTTNEFTPLQTDANGRLKVEAFSGETLPVSLTSTTVTAISAGDNNIGNVDIASIAAGDTNIGNVDIVTVPAPLSTTGSGTAATALRVELANNGTGVMGTVGAVTAITNPVTVAGGAAHASPVSGNPNLVAGRASAAIPTDVGADADTASMWVNRNGAQVVLQAPHVGLNSDPWNLLHEGAQYTSAQTSTVLVAGGAGDKIVVTQCQIQAFSTTAGTVIVYFGTGAFSRGTNRTIFDGEFKPSSTLAPGAILNGPFISGANGDDILVTSVGDIDITVSVWYYIIT